MRILKWAVDNAEDWRGSMTGNPDPGPLREFDENIKIAKGALKKLKHRGKSEKPVTLSSPISIYCPKCGVYPIEGLSLTATRLQAK